MSQQSVLTRVDRKELKLSNLDKPLYPGGFTKGQVIDYYQKIAPVLLPHLKGRPLTMKRYPEGTQKNFFYEKQAPSYKPDWIPTIDVPSERRKVIHFLNITRPAALVWVANLACIELHPYLFTERHPDRPTFVAFDLDPGPPAGLVDCCAVILQMKQMLDSLGLQSFPKLSGGKGLHLYVPLNTPVTFEQTKKFAHAFALTLEKQTPAKVVSKMTKALRKGKVFVDWSQNDHHKTTVCVYSLRARDRPTVSVPVTWEELEAACRRKNVERLRVEAEEVPARLKKHGDLFAPVLKLKQKLP